MRYHLLFYFFTLLVPFASNAQKDIFSSKWLTQMEVAQTQAATNNQAILMVFSGSDWCKPCMLLKREILDHPDFQQYANTHLVLLELDFPAKKKNKGSPEQRKHNEALAERYNPKGAFPTLLLLDASGKILERFSYHARWSVANYIQFIESKIAR